MNTHTSTETRCVLDYFHYYICFDSWNYKHYTIIRCGVYVTYIRCLLHRDNFNFLINYSSDSFPLSIFSLFFYTIPNNFYRFFKAFLAKETVKGINVTQKQNQFPGKTLARLIPRKISPLKRSFSSLFDSTTKDTCLNHCNCTFLHYLNLKFG